ncbi:MAG: NifU family protein [Hyphomicrobiales bacterium]|nr:NifU family protein [Hyphomicrobiales bacterium]MDE2017544.1 NifU family protein [Hyphomicrobiales bacterium]
MSTAPATIETDFPRGDATDLDALLKPLRALEALAETWPEEQRNGAMARVAALDALHAEALRRLVRALKSAPGAARAMREAASDEVVYAVLRRHGVLKPNLFERVEAALDAVRPTLASHGGDVELVSVAPPAVEVRFLGACDGCPASALTFYAGVKKAIAEAVPEITEIKQARGLGGAKGAGANGGAHFVSPFAAGKARDWRRASSLTDLPDGETRVVAFEGRSVLLSRFGEEVTCFENACAHMGMAMDGGEIADGFITCPYHGFKYALQSGECLTAPEVQLRPHAVRVDGDRVDVALSD